MTVPNLPVPPLLFFYFLSYGGEYLVIFLIIITLLGAICTCLLKGYSKAAPTITEAANKWQNTEAEPTSSKAKCATYLSEYWASFQKCTTRSCNCLKRYGGYVPTLLSCLFILGSRKLNVKMFPGLFKEHKDRYQNQSNNRWVTRVFILFLDRKVENNKWILFAFYFLALAIFSSALLVLFVYIPVDISGECLEKDNKLRNLFCYTNESTWQSFPVDCDTYNSTELEEIEFVCYAISISSAGIALAAAMSLTKLATMGITIFIRVSEALYKWSQGGCKTFKCCRRSPNEMWNLNMWIFRVHCLTSIIVLSVSSAVLYIMVTVISNILSTPSEKHTPWPIHTYVAYGILPMILTPSLITVMCTLHKHCDQGEYISYSQDQVPKLADDCDTFVEPANDNDELKEIIVEPHNDMHNETTIAENVDTSTASPAVSTEQPGRECKIDPSISMQDNPSESTQTCPQFPLGIRRHGKVQCHSV